jgi:hypothetical protein
MKINNSGIERINLFFFFAFQKQDYITTASTILEYPRLRVKLHPQAAQLPVGIRRIQKSLQSPLSSSKRPCFQFQEVGGLRYPVNITPFIGRVNFI